MVKFLEFFKPIAFQYDDLCFVCFNNQTNCFLKLSFMMRASIGVHQFFHQPRSYSYLFSQTAVPWAMLEAILVTDIRLVTTRRLLHQRIPIKHLRLIRNQIVNSYSSHRMKKKSSRTIQSQHHHRRCASSYIFSVLSLLHCYKLWVLLLSCLSSIHFLLPF